MRRLRNGARVVLVVATVLAFAACNSPSPVTVVLAPETATLSIGSTQRFSATVAGTAQTDVAWTASAGTVEGSGSSVTYIAPTTPGEYTLVATSVADARGQASATVVVREPLYEQLASQTPDADGGVSGSYGTVAFIGTRQGEEGAEARYRTADGDELIVRIVGPAAGEIEWSGRILDGYGSATEEEEAALRELAVSELADAISMVPLDLACRPGARTIHPAVGAALLMPWQMVLKYLVPIREEVIRAFADRSDCTYFQSVTEVYADSSTFPSPSVMMLSSEILLPMVFGYFPFDGAGQAESDAAIRQRIVEDFEAVLAAAIRNQFGPGGTKCRGACGPDCPSSCDRDTYTECVDAKVYRIVWSYDCGTHLGCRQHDDCLDVCARTHPGANFFVGECNRTCHAVAIQEHGWINTYSWKDGGGPYDGRQTWEYTRSSPTGTETTGRCGRCLICSSDPQKSCEHDPSCGPPPPPCRSCGDPHLYTFDGLAYDFQAAGEFVLIESASGDLGVQARQEPWPASTRVTINTAVAMNVAGDRIGVYRGRSPALLVNGEATELSDASITLPNGGSVSHDGERYLVTWSDGSVVSVRTRGSFLDVGALLAEERKGLVSGLLGNFDGDPSNDVRTRDGTRLEVPVAFEDLYSVYGNSWRVDQGEALFDYEVGEDTDTYTILDFPSAYMTAAMLDAGGYRAAELVCLAAGVSDPVALENCILDVALTGDEAFVESAADSPHGAERLEVCPEPIVIVGDIDGDQNWGPTTATCPSYRVTGRGFIFGHLRIHPGTWVVFEEGASLVSASGSLRAVGTPDSPVIFLGADTTPGYWQGIAFSTNDPANELSYVIVDGAGSGRLGHGDTNDTSVGVRGDARVAITNTIIRNGAGYGLKVVGPEADISGFANNRFEALAGAPLQIHANHVGVIDGDTLYDAPELPNGKHFIEVPVAGRISSDQTWPRTGVPIRFSRRTGDTRLTRLEAHVTVEPGAILEFASETGLDATTAGAFTAQGADGAPITFRGADGTPGDWVGIVIRSEDQRNVLDHAIVADGGQPAPGTGSAANIRVQSGAHLEIRNSTVRNGEGCGISKHPSGALVPDPYDPAAEDPNNTFEHNGGDDIC